MSLSEWARIVESSPDQIFTSKKRSHLAGRVTGKKVLFQFSWVGLTSCTWMGLEGREILPDRADAATTKGEAR